MRTSYYMVRALHSCTKHIKVTCGSCTYACDTHNYSLQQYLRVCNDNISAKLGDEIGIDMRIK